MSLNVFRNSSVLKSPFHSLLIDTFYLTVKTMSHELQQEKRISCATRVLSLFCQHVEDLVVISHAKITTKQQVLRPPVVTTHERMKVFHTALARRGIAQVSHINLTGIRQPAFGKVRILTSAVIAVVEHTTVGFLEYFRNGILTQLALTENIFLARLRVHLKTRNACSFLPTVLLLFHHQIEFPHWIHPRSVFLLIPAERLQ